MEGRLHRRLQIAALVALLGLGALALPARADAPPPPYTDPVNVTVNSDPNAVVVDANTAHHTGGTGTVASGGSGPTCYMRPVPMSAWDDDLELQYWSYRMQKAPYNVYCHNQWQSIVWIDIPDAGSSQSTSHDPRLTAMRLRDQMPIPQVSVKVNPTDGLVGAESWFWVQGYGGAPLTRSTNAFGDLVQVEATVMRYEWSFGDGSTLTSEDLGHAYPARSDVRHVYQRSSDGMPNGYSVDASFVFAVRYRVNGGQWIEIPGITREAHADYPVRESQAVIQQ